MQQFIQAIKVYDTDREYAMDKTISKQQKLIRIYKISIYTIGFLLIIQTIFLCAMLVGTR